MKQDCNNIILSYMIVYMVILFSSTEQYYKSYFPNQIWLIFVVWNTGKFFDQLSFYLNPQN